jgi:hypothetical protein
VYPACAVLIPLVVGLPAAAERRARPVGSDDDEGASGDNGEKIQKMTQNGAEKKTENETKGKAEISARARVEPSPFRWRLEIPLSLSATGTSYGVGTHLDSLVGVRAGATYMRPIGLALGGDIGLVGAWENGGNGTVALGRLLGAIDARGTLGYELAGNRFAVTPHGFVGVLLGLGLGGAKVQDDVSLRPLATWGVRFGGGLTFRLWLVIAHLDLGVGVRDSSPEVLSTAALGLGW